MAVSAPEIGFFLGVAVVVLAVILRAVPKNKKVAAAFVGLVIAGSGAAFGGLAWAGIPAFITLPDIIQPGAENLWEVSFLLSSDTDRTESGEVIVDGGHTIRYTLNDANMDGLGDVNLDVRVTNLNVGASGETWPFEVSLKYVSATRPSGPAQPIVNRTAIGSPDERYDVTYSLTESGAPTLFQDGERAISSDWATGASDQLNIDLTMSPTATDDIAPGTPGQVTFLVGGILMTCDLIEGA